MHHSDLVRVQQQEREQRPLLQAAQRNRPAVDRQSGRAENREPHSADITTGQVLPGFPSNRGDFVIRILFLIPVFRSPISRPWLG